MILSTGAQFASNIFDEGGERAEAMRALRMTAKCPDG
jgi:hypothetical protein